MGALPPVSSSHRTKQRALAPWYPALSCRATPLLLPAHTKRGCAPGAGHRFGVAPDHQDVKNVIDQFGGLRTSGRCELFCNVEVGSDLLSDLRVDELRERYDAVVLAYGAGGDRELGIPGEHLTGVLAARDFVGWYNGSPEHAGLEPPLDARTAVVFGHGNVALDCARLLLSPAEVLAATDIAAHAADALRQSGVSNVLVVGRRGPLDVSFTIKELREITKLPGVTVTIDPDEVALNQAEQAYATASRPRKRLTELIKKAAVGRAGGDNDAASAKRCEVLFRLSPVELLEDPAQPGRVGAVKLAVNRLEGEPGAYRAVPTREYRVVECGLALKSIGYRGLPLPGDDPADRTPRCMPDRQSEGTAGKPDNQPEIPFDSKSGTIPHRAGRIERDGHHEPGLYCAGWIKTGPTGVIATTMMHAFDTAQTMLQDIKSGALPAAASRDGSCIPGDAVTKLLADRGVVPVRWEGWEAIDAVEVERGSAIGKPREKIVSVPEMLEIAAAARKAR